MSVAVIFTDRPSKVPYIYNHLEEHYEIIFVDYARHELQSFLQETLIE